MGDWIASGHLVEAILALTVAEWVGLAAYHRRTGRGVPPRNFWRNLVSGMMLLLALREALIGSSWVMIAGCLALALAAHLADLARQWVR